MAQFLVYCIIEYVQLLWRAKVLVLAFASTSKLKWIHSQAGGNIKHHKDAGNYTYIVHSDRLECFMHFNHRNHFCVTRWQLDSDKRKRMEHHIDSNLYCSSSAIIIFIFICWQITENEFYWFFHRLSNKTHISVSIQEFNTIESILNG